MRLNDLKPAEGSRKNHVRVGRGGGSGLGKTCGRGHKGQRARAGGYHKVGFEGGQMPLQRRLPKIGFRSHKKHETAEVCLYRLVAIQSDVIDAAAVVAAGLVHADVKRIKVISRGTVERKLTIKGLAVTSGARAAIEAAGGTIED
jgi:large subunit ribosomal protein L15